MSEGKERLRVSKIPSFRSARLSLSGVFSGGEKEREVGDRAQRRSLPIRWDNPT